MVRALLKLRCGNTEEANKYWKGGKDWECVFCGKGQDRISHYVKECNREKGWFYELGSNMDEIWNKIWDD